MASVLLSTEMPCEEQGYQEVLGRYLRERQGCHQRGAVSFIPCLVSSESASEGPISPQVNWSAVSLPAVFLSSSFLLQFSETEFCTGLGCVMLLAVLFPTCCRCLDLNHVWLQSFLVGTKMSAQEFYHLKIFGWPN
jgi:hypothetical protein